MVQIVAVRADICKIQTLVGPGPQSFAKACNQGRSNYLAEQFPLGPEAVYQAVMSPRIICLPAPEASRSAAPAHPPRAQALSEGLLTSLEAAYWRAFCLGRLCLEPNSCKSAWESDGIWAVETWSPGKEGWGDMGMGDGGSLKHTSRQQQVPFS